MAEFAPHDLTDFYSHPPFLVSASSYFSTLPPWKAFDGGVTYWIGQNGGADWLQLDLGPGYSALIGSYQIRVNSVPEPARAPKNWTMKGSADGRTWATLDTRTNQTAWASGETRSFTVSGVSTYYRFFRLDITANNGDATYTQVAELFLIGTPQFLPDFAPHDLTGNSSHSPFVASASSVFSFNAAYKAFDGVITGASSAKNWLGTGGGTDWLQLDCGAVYTLTSYNVASQNEPNRAPKNWTMQGSNNGSAWVTLDTQSNQTAWGLYESRLYIVTGAAAYRFFRLNITANNGDATYTQVAELYLFGTAGGGSTAQSRTFIID